MKTTKLRLVRFGSAKTLILGVDNGRCADPVRLDAVERHLGRRADIQPRRRMDQLTQLTPTSRSLPALSTPRLSSRRNTALPKSSVIWGSAANRPVNITFCMSVSWISEAVGEPISPIPLRPETPFLRSFWTAAVTHAILDLIDIAEPTMRSYIGSY